MIRPIWALLLFFLTGLLCAQGTGLPEEKNKKTYSPEKWELQPLTTVPRQRPVFKPVVLGQADSPPAAVPTHSPENSISNNEPAFPTSDSSSHPQAISIPTENPQAVNLSPTVSIPEPANRVIFGENIETSLPASTDSGTREVHHPETETTIITDSISDTKNDSSVIAQEMASPPARESEDHLDPDTRFMQDSLGLPKEPESVSTHVATYPAPSKSLEIVQSILEKPVTPQKANPPAPVVSPTSRSPVITSLNKHIPSLTSFQFRPVPSTPAFQVFEPGKYQDCFPRITRTDIWAEQAPVLSATPNPETFHQFQASWNPSLLAEITDSLLKQATEMKLNDAGLYLMTLTLSEHIYPRHTNEARLLAAVLMQRAGFRVQAVIQNNQTALLVNTRQALFGIPALGREGAWGENWYLWQGNVEEGESGPVLAPEPGELALLKPLDLNLYEFPEIPGESITRKLIYSDGVTKTQDTFFTELNLGAIRFLAALPQMSPEVYFNAVVSPGVASTLVQQLKARVAPMRSYEALGWLLRFVQNAFPYQTDETQFGGEKAMFLEEAFVFPYTDCEDRSVLFGVLVKEVLGRNIIGLDFPGHMAVGVATPRREARGARLVYRGNIYMACDPSYKRALPGSLSENILRQTPKAIPVRRLGMPFEAGKDF